MEFQIKKILALTNFSDCANNMIKVAIGIAQRHGAELHLLHVVKRTTAGHVAIINDKILPASQQLLNEAREKIKLQAESIAANSLLTVKTHVALGRLESALPKIEQDKNIDLTMVGADYIKGIKELFFDSKTMVTIKSSTCAVMTIPPEFERFDFKTLLYPIRDVDGAMEKFRYLTPILEKNQSSLHLLGIYNAARDSEIFPVTDKLKVLRDAIRDYPNKITYEVVSSTRLPDTVIDTAQKRESDLIVINASLDEKWYWLLTERSYTHQLVSKSACPILCVKPELVTLRDDDLDATDFIDEQGYLPLSYQYL